MEFGFLKMICRMGIFMICAQAIVHFRPKASYEKYLKMLVSSMVLIQLLMSVGGIFWTDGQEELTERAEELVQSFEQSIKQVSESTFFTEDEQFRITGEKPEVQQEDEETGITGREISVNVAPVSPIRIGGTKETE